MPACLAPRRRTRRGEPVMRVQRAGGSREKGAKHEDGGDVEREREERGRIHGFERGCFGRAGDAACA
jgi:hypothetical protein